MALNEQHSKLKRRQVTPSLERLRGKGSSFCFCGGGRRRFSQSVTPSSFVFFGSGKFSGQLLGGAGFHFGHRASKAVARVRSSTRKSLFSGAGFRYLWHGQVPCFSVRASSAVNCRAVQVFVSAVVFQRLSPAVGQARGNRCLAV